MSSEEMILNGRYKLIESIGSGGMSIVYKAQDMSLGRLVAIKMLHKRLTNDDAFLRRFHREAHAAANLTHPNIVTVHDIGQDKNNHYIVLEYVEGATLKEIIREQNRQGQPMSVNRALNLIIQTCAGIGYAHRADLVHCDVKPQNILVTRDDRVKVADFGIAQAISEVSQQRDGQVWGTPQYFSPEQAAGESATPASDVYAIGVVMFELLSGRLPFEADTHADMAIKHLREQPPPLTLYNPVVPHQLERIILKVLAKEPSGRYRTAGQLGRILTSYRQSSQAETGPTYPVTPGPTQQGLPISEQKTQVISSPRHPQTAATQVQFSATTLPQYGQTTRFPADPAPEPDTDWVAIGLGITALIFLLGLIPLWYLVYRAFAG